MYVDMVIKCAYLLGCSTYVWNCFQIDLKILYMHSSLLIMQ